MVKTYLKYEHSKTFSSAFLCSASHSQVIMSVLMGECILSAANECLIVTKSGTSNEIKRVFPESKECPSILTCFRAFYLREDFAMLWQDEVSDGEGIDDPHGFFDEKEALHLSNRKKILSEGPKSFKNSKGQWIVFLGYQNGQCSLYSLTKDKFVMSLDAHSNSISSVDVLESSMGQLNLVSVSIDKEVKIHDLMLKGTHSELKNHLSGVVDARFLNFQGRDHLIQSYKGKVFSLCTCYNSRVLCLPLLYCSL